MKKPLFNASDTVESRLSKLELVTGRIALRTHKTASAIVTPYPISNSVVGEDLIGESLKGVILRYMFPCDGVIKKGCIRLDKKLKVGALVDIKIFNDKGSSSSGYTIDKKVKVIDPTIEVVTSDCLEVTIAPITNEDRISEVWISLLWIPSISDADIKHFLIEELEDKVDDLIEA